MVPMGTEMQTTEMAMIALLTRKLQKPFSTQIW